MKKIFFILIAINLLGCEVDFSTRINSDKNKKKVIVTDKAPVKASISPILNFSLTRSIFISIELAIIFIFTRSKDTKYIGHNKKKRYLSVSLLLLTKTKYYFLLFDFFLTGVFTFFSITPSFISSLTSIFTSSVGSSIESIFFILF